MVKISEIRESNAQFALKHPVALVCVFVGATSGIRAGTLNTMVSMLGPGSKFYVLGRSKSRFEKQNAHFHTLNPTSTIVFVEAEVSLLSQVDVACKKIVAAESKIDYLYMSQGAVPLNGAEYTKEGLETNFNISYYSRMRFIQNLLPLLRKSSHPRVLTLLNAGREKAMINDDLGLEKHWSVANIINHSTTMNSLATEYLAAHEKEIVFIHAGPGRVKTNIFSKLRAPHDSGIVWKCVLPVLQSIVAILYWWDGIEVDECGRRQAYNLIREDLGPGAWRVDELSEVVEGQSVLGAYRDEGWVDKVWEHTVGIFDRVTEAGREDVTTA